MEQAKSFQDMLKEGTVTATEGLLATGIAMVVIGILAILAPLTSGVVFDMLFGALLIGAEVVCFIGGSLIVAGVARISLARRFRKATDLLGAPPLAQRDVHA